MEIRSQLDEKLQQSSNTFMFKPLPARGGHTAFCRALFKYLSLFLRLLWVLPLCHYAELWPEEQVSSRDCDQQCKGTTRSKHGILREIQCMKRFFWGTHFVQLAAVLSSDSEASGRWRRLSPVQFSCVRSTFCQEPIVARCHGWVTLWGGSFAIFGECASFKGTNLC